MTYSEALTEIRAFTTTLGRFKGGSAPLALAQALLIAEDALNQLPKLLDRVATLDAEVTAGSCKNCGSTENLTVDHIKPVDKGGVNERSNLQCLCFPCNRAKSNKWKE
jgi:5-methylcytosine-specific restriction endonuclease McrA